ncbi:MAG: hypothetical protein R6U61_02345 [Thermoplasmata archaeon]
MPTTITVKKDTKKRLSDYKMGSWTYDDVLQMLMDHVSLKDISAEHLEEHYRRLEDFKGVSKEEFKKHLKKRLTQGN